MTKPGDSHLHNQLIKLGDMMGDGLHLEPGGKWIEQEYSKIARALGYSKPKANNSSAINEGMGKALEKARCSKCGGTMKQTRSGSLRAECLSCGSKFQFKRQSKARK